MSCRLCSPEKVTPWYYEDSNVLVFDCDCQKCKVPMVVLKRHTREPNVIEANIMKEKLCAVMKKFYSGKEYRIDKVMRAIPDHVHWHARFIKS